MPASKTRWVDATGFPVLPSVSPSGQPYWYREDLRVSKSYRPRESFWESPRWMAVQRLFNHEDYPHFNKRDWNGSFKPDTSREFAYEVPRRKSRA